MNNFKRHTGLGLINNMKADPLWRDHLKPDCEKGEVFLAIRDDAIDFYHKGGRLFEYRKKGFGTDITYASIYDTVKTGFIYEQNLNELKPIGKFSDKYEAIKARCKTYAGDEAKSVSNLYKKYSYLLTTGDIAVLDIEVAFKPLQNSETHERIDVLLYNRVSRSLQFVEAKRLSDSRLFSEKIPEVIGQLDRYTRQIKAKGKEIVDEYRLYIENINMVFDKNFPHPKIIEKDVILWIFDFDGSQKDDTLSLLLRNQKYRGVKVYANGDAKKASPEKIWNAEKL